MLEITLSTTKNETEIYTNPKAPSIIARNNPFGTDTADTCLEKMEKAASLTG